jgi:hypothetical protein
MFDWLASFLVLFLHNNPAQVRATAQQHSTGAGTTQTLHSDVDGGVGIGGGTSNGSTGQ